jgi:hypothetical protein
MIFILFAGAFALEEYTSSTEHGWISEPFLCTVLQLHHLPTVYVANVLTQVVDSCLTLMQL